MEKQYKEWMDTQITQVANSATDLEEGFDKLFQYMSRYPESATAAAFREYHFREENDPRLETGEANFTYLIGREFHPEEWYMEKDLWMPAEGCCMYCGKPVEYCSC